MTSSGSAWVLDEHHLVTNAHVIATDPTPTLVSRDGSVVLDGTVIGAETDPDIAVIHVEATLPPALDWAPTGELTEGQDIVALGYPAPAGDFSVIPSTIISFQQEGAVREAIRSDGAVDHGNSGGPAITQDGAVAGVVTLMLIERSQLQMVPILFTADALQPTVEGMLANPSDVQADCDEPAYGVVPDGWDIEGWDGAESSEAAYGDDPGLDSLWDSCASGDLAACDELYLSSGWGSEYEEFGATCGQTAEPAYGMCQAYADWDAEAAAIEDEQQRADAEAQAALDALRASCEGGDMQACDDLQWEASYGSAEYDVAESCGGHFPDGWASCVDREGDAAEEAEHAAGLLALVASCEGGDMQACDDLQWEASYGSAEYDVAESCGGHFPDGWSSCVEREADADAMAGLISACEGGDMEGCDDLWYQATPGTPAYDVAENCGGRYPGEGGMCVWAQEDDTP
ncbi:trypsin-like peptidase domain-containing protein [Ornithinimicrobium faecis]|nr:trypsin-like peptidase domain-containing protein [Ornithinimicrobium sp. HY1745]